MAQEIQCVEHCSTSIQNKIGEGTRVLGAIRNAGVNLIALWGYPRDRYVGRHSFGTAQTANLVLMNLSIMPNIRFLANAEDQDAEVDRYTASLRAGNRILGQVGSTILAKTSRGASQKLLGRLHLFKS